MLCVLSQVDHAKATVANKVNYPIGANLCPDILYLEGACKVLPALRAEPCSATLPGSTALLGDEVEADYHRRTSIEHASLVRCLMKIKIGRWIRLRQISERRQATNDLHGLQANRDDTLQEPQWVGRVANGFDGIAIGVVDNAAGRISLDTLSFHHPFQSGLAVDHVVVGFQWNTGDGDVAVVDHGALIEVRALTSEFHLFDTVETDWVGRRDHPGIATAETEDDGVGLNRLVVAVQITEFPTCGSEGPEVCGPLHRRDAWEFLGEVISIAAAVVLRVQQAIGVVEQVVRGDRFAWLSSLEVGQTFIGDSIAALASNVGVSL